jgi:uncharacterized DUF497 family protein
VVDVVHVLQAVEFTWDSAKAVSNIQRHGVAFETACEVFFDPFVHTAEPEVRGGEHRHRSIGLTIEWVLIVVAFTFREDSIRIISAREATPLERRRYEDQQDT